MNDGMTTMNTDLVKVDRLCVEAIGRDGPPILDSVSFSVQPGRMTALVGESGAGKSMTTKAVLGILDDRLFRVTGDIELVGQDVTAMSRRARRLYTSGVAALVFQNPTSALNPTQHVGPQIAEAMRFRIGGARMSEREARERAIELMRQVGIAAPGDRYYVYPHQMSGGMKQRAVIAIALSLEPQVLFCDEPTSSLDVTTQAVIMDLFDELRERLDIGILFITHDLVLAASRADEVVVLHSGRIVEQMPVESLFESAAMPYTRDLIERVPSVGVRPEDRHQVLPLAEPVGPSACSYVQECRYRGEICTRRTPPLVPVGPAHEARCWFPPGHEPTDQSLSSGLVGAREEEGVTVG